MPVAFIPLRLSWKRALLFPTQGCDSWAKLRHGGWWLLLCPPLGWLLALGYRRAVALRLADGVEPALPSWQGQHLDTLWQGGKAVAVILTYFAPFLTLYWVLAVPDAATLWEHRQEAGWFLFLLPWLLPVTLPALVLGSPRWHPWMTFTPAAVVILAALFVLTTFLLPAAFLQVSLHRRFRYALRLDRVIKLVVATPRLYVEAWLVSLLATAAAALSGPLMPWGIFWSYLVIGFTFNEALVFSGQPGVSERFANSIWLPPEQRGVEHTRSQ